MLAIDGEGVIVYREAHPAQPPGAVLDVGTEAGVVSRPQYCYEIVRLTDHVYEIESSFSVCSLNISNISSMCS
ncbi:MAG: hypothetical protein ACKPKO_44450, partial [Candidatus Fonsibacter sp.]